MIAPATLFAALAAFAAVEAAPISLATVEASLSTPNSTQTNQKIERYQMNGNAGACGWYNKDSDVVVGLPLEFCKSLKLGVLSFRAWRLTFLPLVRLEARLGLAVLR